MAKPDRVGNWVTTLPFALNNVGLATNETVTGAFTLPFTDTMPVIAEFDSTKANPSGWRHRKEHPSFVKLLASGAGLATLAFKSFDLQATDISTGSGVSQTKVMLFRIAKFSSPGTTRIHKMRVWAFDTTDFLEPQTHRVLYITSTPWISGFTFVPGDLGNESFWLPTSLPENQNLFRTGRIDPRDNFTGEFTNIVGSGDVDVSQWIYIALGASGTMPLGEYGNLKDGIEGFRLRITYNIDNLGLVFGD